MPPPNPALEQFIKSIPLFSLVAPDELMEILRLLRPVELSAGEVLFREGEPGRSMWVLGAGAEVSISTTPAGSKRPVAVAYAKTGDVLGEMALIDDGPRSGTAVVVQSGHAHQIDANEFHSLRSTFHSAAFKVLRRICIDLCTRLRATNERIVPSSTPGIETSPLEASAVRPRPEVLDDFPPFAQLPATVKLALAQKLKLIEVSELTPVFSEGEVSAGAYFLLEGEVTVGRNGKTLATLHPGSIFGLVSAIDSGRRSASCVTNGPARLLKLTDADFDALFSSGHRFAYQLVDLVARQLVEHLRHANAMLPMPGRAAGSASAGTPIAAVSAAVPDSLPGLGEMLPLELEMDLADLEPAAGLLG